MASSFGFAGSAVSGGFGGSGSAAGGGAVGGGYYDRPNAPVAGTQLSGFDRHDFLNGLFDPNAFSKPAPGQGGSLGRNTFRGPHYTTLDISLARAFTVVGERQIQIRVEAFNALNNVNFYLPNTDLSLALLPDGTFSKNSTFGKSTQAFDARTIQASVRYSF